MIWEHKPYHFVSSIGVSEEIETLFRNEFPEETGMLVVNHIVREGPSDQLFQVGDVMISLNDKYVTKFLQIEEVLDESIGEEVRVTVVRGSEMIDITVVVDDLHRITPNEYITISKSTIHNVSYMQALNYSIPCKGITLVSAGYMFLGGGLSKGSILLSLNGEPLPTLTEFIRVISQYTDRSKVVVRYITDKDKNRERVGIIEIDWRWTTAKMWKRVNNVWESNDIEKPTGEFKESSIITSPVRIKNELADFVLSSLVMVTFRTPYIIDGIHGSLFVGTGIIIDSVKGLVVVDKNTVPGVLGDCSISFGASVQIPAKIVFVHPTHYISIVRYDVELLGKTTFKSIELDYDSDPIPGEEKFYVSLGSNQKAFFQSVYISKVQELFVKEGKVPKCRPINEETIRLVKASSSVGGVLVNSDGTAFAQWVAYNTSKDKSYFSGLPYRTIKNVIETFKNTDDIPIVYSLEVEFFVIPLTLARNMGLDEKWIHSIEHSDTIRFRHVLKIRQIMPYTGAYEKLRIGDIIVSINGKLVTSFLEVEDEVYGKDSVDILIVRDQVQLEVTVEVEKLDGIGSDKVIFWSGAWIQDTHRYVLARGVKNEGVYISRWSKGSPAHKYGIRAIHWITHINETPTPNLNEFEEAVQVLEHQSFVRVRVIDIQGRVDVVSLKTDNIFWETSILERQPDATWKRSTIPRNTPLSEH
eukprot:TRINITY_DN4024_c0_g1_i2.p1 TRINITY_DN4024_c0_g1~~TRINITY_DN4024_c0_g1_i2.p1  ORF type:complete len:698 (-),score=149.94 TRINITY_DN4024_c0_g1_i2:237-2330(-)